MKAGIGFADITPSIGMRTELFQDLKVDRIVTPLLLKVCILKSGEKAAAVVSADVMDFFSDSVKDIRGIISSIAGIPEGNIFLNSSHTHSAPYIYPSAQRYLDDYGIGFLDLNYYKYLLKGVENATHTALEGLEEVIIRHSRGFVEGVACNRRPVLADGTIGIRYGRGVEPELVALPDGVIDPYAECLWFESKCGALKFAIVNYACHGTSYGELSEICWDYMGYARSLIEEKAGAEVMFLQGCAGNMSPGKYTVHEPLEDAMLLGSRLAQGVLESRGMAKVIKDEDVTFVNSKLVLQGRTTLNKNELKKRLDNEISKVKSDLAGGQSGPQGAMVISYLERYLMFENYPDLNIPNEIGFFKIGDLNMFFFPGECFIQYALKIKELRMGKPTMVMSYTDCTLQYVPNSGAYEEIGGYETDPDWCYSEKGNGEKLVEAALKLIDGI